MNDTAKTIAALPASAARMLAVEILLADPEASRYVDKKSLQRIFSGETQRKRIQTVIDGVLKRQKMKGHHGNGKSEGRAALRGKS